MLERKWWTLVVVCLAIFMLLLDITIVNVALPPIARDLGATFTDLQWVIDAYALTLATFVLNAGSLADLLGRKRVFIGGLVLLTAASVACGATTSPLSLILSRAGQGIGGSIMFATSLALLSQEFQGRERGTAFGIWGATTGAAVAVGPLIGGALTTYLSWRWIFFVNIPIGIVATILSVAQLRETLDEEHGGIDWIGLVTLSASLFMIVFALLRGNEKGWTSVLIVGMFAGGAALLLAFVLSQHYGRRAMIDLSLFTRAAFTGAQITAFALSCAVFAYVSIFEHHFRAAFPGIRTEQLNAFASGRFNVGNAPKGVVHQVQTTFIGGLHELFVVGTCIAAVGAVLALTLVRRRDFAAATAPAQG